MKVILLEIYQKEYEDSHTPGTFKPYYEIWVSDRNFISRNGKGRVFKMKAFDNETFKPIADKSRGLIAQEVLLVIKSKPNKQGDMVSFVEDIKKV